MVPVLICRPEPCGSHGAPLPHVSTPERAELPSEPFRWPGTYLRRGAGQLQAEGVSQELHEQGCVVVVQCRRRIRL